VAPGTARAGNRRAGPATAAPGCAGGAGRDADDCRRSADGGHDGTDSASAGASRWRAPRAERPGTPTDSEGGRVHRRLVRPRPEGEGDAGCGQGGPGCAADRPRGRCRGRPGAPEPVRLHPPGVGSRAGVAHHGHPDARRVDARRHPAEDGSGQVPSPRGACPAALPRAGIPVAVAEFAVSVAFGVAAGPAAVVGSAAGPGWSLQGRPGEGRAANRAALMAVPE